MAGTIKLDGATFLEKDGGNYKISNTELKLKSSGNTIVDSSGNALVSESSGKVTLQGVTLGDTAVPNTPMMFRNKLINGNFDIWQRGTSQTSSGYGSADRWNLINSGSTKTASQQAFTLGQTEVPGNPKYYLRTVVTSGAGAGDYVINAQRIESVYTLSGKTATLSFWAKAGSNKNITTQIRQIFGTGSNSPSSVVNDFGITTHSLTTSWQKFTTTVSIPSISGKTIGTNNNDYLELRFWLDAGSNSSAESNSLPNQSGTFDIAQVQLEEGSAATPFEQRPIGVELSLCQRYYWTFYTTVYNFSYATAASQWLTEPLYNPVTMRVTPTVTVSTSSVAGSSNSVTVTAYSTNASILYLQASGANNDIYATGLNFTASSEL